MLVGVTIGRYKPLVNQNIFTHLQHQHGNISTTCNHLLIIILRLLSIEFKMYKYSFNFNFKCKSWSRGLKFHEQKKKKNIHIIL